MTSSIPAIPLYTIPASVWTMAVQLSISELLKYSVSTVVWNTHTRTKLKTLVKVHISVKWIAKL